MTDPTPIGVLFVCHANVCRSPLAEGIFAHLVQRHGLSSRIVVDSAGVFAAEGHDPHPLSVQVAAQYGIELRSCSRPFVPEDLVRFDHVIAMDRANEDEILRLRRMSAFGEVEGQNACVRLFRRILDPHARGMHLDVPDPIGQGPDSYARLYDLLQRGCIVLLDELIRGVVTPGTP